MTHTIYIGEDTFAEARAMRDYALSADIGGVTENHSYEALLELAPKSRFVPLSPEPIQGHDGFMYYPVGIPPANNHMKKTYPVVELVELAEACQQGFGVLLFPNLDDMQEPFWRLTMGDMLCYLDHQNLLGVPSELAEIADPVGMDPVEIAPVDEELLPDVARELLSPFFDHIGFPDIGVAAVIDKREAPHRSLMLNIAPEEVDDEMVERIKYTVGFFLKPLRRVRLNDFLLEADDFTPLYKE